MAFMPPYGDVRYEINADSLGAGQCYCRDCQYSSGGGPANAFVVPKDSVTLLRGEPQRYESSTAKGNLAVRRFCPRCGTPLFGEKSSPVGMVAVMTGSLDDTSAFRPSTVGWITTASAWAHLDPRLRRFDRDVEL